MKRLLTPVCIALAATTAVAHQGVKNPDVMARMNSMTSAKDAFREVLLMASEKAPFDAVKAAAARDILIRSGQDTPSLFANGATDPKSEALPVIWTQFDDFTAKAQSFTAAAIALDPTSLAGLKAGMPAVGEGCRACHFTYRKEEDG
ncbi:c-type cytochrome [Shimia ponticola]|uniref:c-type cytochrome n=1 Tax=Shimia ponticola TaxID=2582893 RepID=UPI0011BFCFC6|nr:cytochrome c [Shimia ponticola]